MQNLLGHLKNSGYCFHADSKYFGERCESSETCLQTWPVCAFDVAGQALAPAVGGQTFVKPFALYGRDGEPRSFEYLFTGSPNLNRSVSASSGAGMSFLLDKVADAYDKNIVRVIEPGSSYRK